MSDEDHSAPQAPVSDADSANPWLKSASQTLGIIVAVVGIVVSLITLKQKANADRDTATINLQTLTQKAAADKDTAAINLKTLEQKALNDKVAANFNQQSLREKDEADKATAAISLKAELIKLQIAERDFELHRQEAQDLKARHQADLLHEREVTKEHETYEQIQRLTQVIDHLFSSGTSSEGDLAVLFRFAQENDELREVIVNAVIVRLGAPRSVEEIRLAIRLLTRIGSSTLPAVVEINRTARRSYDDAIIERFRVDVLSQLLDIQSKHLVIEGDAAIKRLGEISGKLLRTQPILPYCLRATFVQRSRVWVIR